MSAESDQIVLKIHELSKSLTSSHDKLSTIKELNNLLLRAFELDVEKLFKNNPLLCDGLIQTLEQLLLKRYERSGSNDFFNLFLFCKIVHHYSQNWNNAAVVLLRLLVSFL